MYIYTCSLRDFKLGESLSRHISRLKHSISDVHIVKHTRRGKTLPTGYASCNRKKKESSKHVFKDGKLHTFSVVE